MIKRARSADSVSNQKQSRRSRFRDEQGSTVLAELEERFAQFRAEHPRGTRVPRELRLASLAALSVGVTGGDLQRMCGVSWGQLEAWKSMRRPGRNEAPGREAAVAKVQTFSVVDAAPEEGLASAVAVEHELELRLGSWCVRVRLAEPRGA